MINIGIIGIGGVGGHLAAVLSKYYENSEAVRIHLYARGATAEVLKRNGITLVSDEKEQQIKATPRGVYSNGEESPILDYLFVCVKSYSIDSIINQIKDITDTKTVIIPLMNGVDGREKLINNLPDRCIADGCVYIISKILSPAVIEIKSSNDKTIYYIGGHSDEQNRAIQSLGHLLKAAYTNIHVKEKIDESIWQKFIRISTSSTLQSYHRVTNGEIAVSESLRNDLITLIEEFMAVANALGHAMSEDTLQRNLKYLTVVPKDMTTSMQRDFEDKRVTELETITGYIVHRGKEIGVTTPLYSTMYNALKKRENSFFSLKL